MKKFFLHHLTESILHWSLAIICLLISGILILGQIYNFAIVFLLSGIIFVPSVKCPTWIKVIVGLLLTFI